VKLIAELKSEDLIQIAARNLGGAGGPAQLAIAQATPERARVAFRHLLFSTAMVPLTDGYRMRLRHLGHAQNMIAGPLLKQNVSEECVDAEQLDDTEKPILEAPTMPTLQRMHELCAAHPVLTAEFFLLQEELSYRHLYCVVCAMIGRINMPSIGRFESEDGWVSNGRRGLANYLRMFLKAIEAQGRGFTHGHAKYAGCPNGKEELQQLVVDLAAGEADSAIRQHLQQFNEKLAAVASTMQYECSTLPGRQLAVQLPPEPFSAKQQRQSKLDGGLELDGSTRRALLEITPPEPWSHIAEEKIRASSEHREPRHPYKELPLTKCQLFTWPSYRWPHSFGKNYQLSDEGYLKSGAEQLVSS